MECCNLRYIGKNPIDLRTDEVTTVNQEQNIVVKDVAINGNVKDLVKDRGIFNSKSLTGTDYNTITKQGVYAIPNTGSTNGPGYTAKLLVYSVAESPFVTQVAIDTGSVAIKCRYKSDTVNWTPWETIIFNTDTATSSKAGLVMPDDSSLKIVDASSGKVSVEDVLYNGTISLIESGALGKARYITSSESFNVDTDDFDLVLVNASGHDGVYPSGFGGFIYVRQLYYSRTSSSVIGNRMQLAFAYNANHTWSRYYIDGVWSDWVKFVKGTDLATTSKAGIVQLNNTVTSTSTTQAATANAVKMAYDKAIEASESTGRSETADKLTTARTIQTNLASTAAGSFDGSKNITIGVSGTLPTANGGTGRTDGKAPSLVTARTIGIGGVVTGTATAFDGSKNITIDTTTLNLEDAGVTGELPIAHGGTGRTDGKAVGLVTKRTIDGVYFDGAANITHFGTCSTAAATAAKVVSVANFVLATGAEVTVQFTVTNTAASPTLNVNNTGAKAIVYRNTAISAGYLAANRVYKFVYDGTNYELIGDIDTNTKYTAASATPKAPGTAAVGTSSKYAREDHVHPLQTTVSGNAGSATKLATARTIGITGVVTGTATAFDGSKNISIDATKLNIEDTGITGELPIAHGGTGRTDGKAAALVTARTISLTGAVTGSTTFDGSKNVSISTNIGSISGTIPIGGIIAFSGTFGGTGSRYPIPLGSTTPDTNWCLCDGTTTNGKAVPDLRGRMILGASTSHASGTKGGSETHTHSISGTVGETTLTTSQLASHNHRTYYLANDGGGGSAWNVGEPSHYTGYVNTTSSGSSQEHTHTLSGTKSTSASSFPPYYALAFIIRVA